MVTAIYQLITLKNACNARDDLFIYVSFLFLWMLVHGTVTDNLLTSNVIPIPKGNKKGQHRSCHTAKCNMLNKCLKTKNFHTGYSYFHFHHHTPQTWPFHNHAHMHKNKSHTYNNIRTYEPHHQKVEKLGATTWRISSISCRRILVLFGLRSTSAAIWRLSCNTYADALNSIEFCIVRLFLCHLSTILKFVIRFVSNFYNLCPLSLPII